jgi:hypothetical protein
MRGRKLAVTVVIIAGLIAVALSVWTHRVPARQPPLTHIDAGSLTQFQERFNAAQDETRVLLLLSPT